VNGDRISFKSDEILSTVAADLPARWRCAELNSDLPNRLDLWILLQNQDV
jgi:hypothetical protein